jgi:hypothetical protein
MSFRLPAVALLTAIILAACSEAPVGPRRAILTEKPSLVMDAGVACTGVTMPVIECQALVAFFNATNGPNWVDAEGWTAGANPCRWIGVECTEGDHGSVLMLSRVTKNLSGVIPPELGNLDAMTHLSLAGNEFSGPVPGAVLSGLASIKVLGLSQNHFSGSIPAELGNLTTLETLSFYNNDLTGSIPASLGNLTQLKYLGLDLNELTGSIPATFGNLANLEDLMVSGNQLIGPLPASLGNLVNLQTFYMSENLINGPIPASFGNLANLRWWDARENDMTGSIPATLGNLSNLEALILDDNALTGTIPASLGNLSSLNHLFLSRNALTGSIPASLGNLDVIAFYVDGNQLSGVLPIEVATLGGSILSCHTRPGNGGLSIPNTQAYHDVDLDGNGVICDLPIGTPADLALQMIDEIEDLVPASLSNGQANSLTTKLDNAMRKAEKGQYGEAVGQMETFMAQVQGMLSNGAIPVVAGLRLYVQGEALLNAWAAVA